MASEKYIVVAGLGPDRPGLVAETTRFLTDRGANVEDSRAVVLGGEFGLMVLASGPEYAIRRISEEIEMLQKATGIPFLSRITISPEEHRRTRALPYRIEANAMDHEGIVSSLSDALYKAGINIVSLETSTREAPVTGTPLFSLVAHVDLPAGLAPETVRQALADVAQTQNLDVDMRPEF